MHTAARLPAAALLLIAAAAAPAQDAPPPEAPADTPRDVTALLEPALAAGRLPGIVGVVVARDRVVATGAAGVRLLGEDEPLRVEDPMHLGSCTKAMTATLCAILVRRSRLAWDTTVHEALRKVAPDMDPGWRRVTLADLLRNRGGAPHDLKRDGLWGRLTKRVGTPREQRRMLVRGVTAHPPEHEPGERFEYSNAGFALAGAMAEEATNTAWEDLMRVHLFEPLGMASAGFGPPGSTAGTDAPHGHRSDGRPMPASPKADNPPAIGPAGTVHASLPDWGKFVSLHLDGERAGRVGLEPADLDRLHEPAPIPEGEKAGPYAMGWGTPERGWGGGRVLTHSGSNTLWFCVVWAAPERDFAILVATNIAREDTAKHLDTAVAALLRDHLEQEKRRESEDR